MIPEDDQLHPSQRIIRHEPAPSDLPSVPRETCVNLEAIEEHVARWIAPSKSVFHELISHLVHVDVLYVPPGLDRDWQTLVTSGMSDKPMSPPPDLAGATRFAELCLCLPPDWPLDERSLKDERNYWPLRWLKMIARLPHEYHTWIDCGHTIPSADPPVPYHRSTKFCCMLVARPILVPESFHTLHLPGGRAIEFFSLLPLYPEEVEFKLRHGSEALIDRLAEVGASELVDIRRPNVGRG